MYRFFVLVTGLVGIILSLCLPSRPEIKARIHVIRNTTIVSSQLVCKVNCDNVCRRSQQAPPGTLQCNDLHNETENALCIKYETQCCESIPYYCSYGSKHSSYYCGSICTNRYDRQICTASCRNDWILTGLCEPSYKWLVTKKAPLPFHVVCGPSSSPPRCKYPQYYHVDSYFLTMELFILLSISIVLVVSSLVLMFLYN
jgi:hypothetical protein